MSWHSEGLWHHFFQVHGYHQVEASIEVDCVDAPPHLRGYKDHVGNALIERTPINHKIDHSVKWEAGIEEKDVSKDPYSIYFVEAPTRHYQGCGDNT